MSENATQARPYAKALFLFALEHHDLASWSQRLDVLTQVVNDALAERFISNPSISTELKIELVLSAVCASVSKVDEPSMKQWITLLAHHKRLFLLPAIAEQFEQLRAEQEKTLTVSVTSFGPLTATQTHDLALRLSQRLQRQVTLAVHVDPSLLGGAVIHAGDWVMDDSVRFKLTKLGSCLAA